MQNPRNDQERRHSQEKYDGDDRRKQPWNYEKPIGDEQERRPTRHDVPQTD